MCSDDDDAYSVDADEVGFEFVSRFDRISFGF